MNKEEEFIHDELTKLWNKLVAKNANPVMILEAMLGFVRGEVWCAHEYSEDCCLTAEELQKYTDVLAQLAPGCRGEDYSLIDSEYRKEVLDSIERGDK